MSNVTNALHVDRLPRLGWLPLMHLERFNDVMAVHRESMLRSSKAPSLKLPKFDMFKEASCVHAVSPRM